MKKIHISEQNFIESLMTWYSFLENRGTAFSNEPNTHMALQHRIKEALLDLKKEMDCHLTNLIPKDEPFQPIALNEHVLSIMLQLVELHQNFPKNDDTLVLENASYQKIVEMFCHILTSGNQPYIDCVNDFLEDTPIPPDQLPLGSLTWRYQILEDMVKIKGNSLVNYAPLYSENFLNEDSAWDCEVSNQEFIFSIACNAGNDSVLENPQFSPDWLSRVSSDLKSSHLTYRHCLMMQTSPIEMLKKPRIFPELFLRALSPIKTSQKKGWSNMHEWVFSFFESKCEDGTVQSWDDLLQLASQNSKLREFLDKEAPAVSLVMFNKHKTNSQLLFKHLINSDKLSYATPFVQNLLQALRKDDPGEWINLLTPAAKERLEKYRNDQKIGECVNECKRINVASSNDIFRVLAQLSPEDSLLTKLLEKEENPFTEDFINVCNQLIVTNEAPGAFLNTVTDAYLKGGDTVYTRLIAQLKRQTKNNIEEYAVIRLKDLIEEEFRLKNIIEEEFKRKNTDPLQGIRQVSERFASKVFLESLAPDTFEPECGDGGDVPRTNFTITLGLLITSEHLPQELLRKLASGFVFHFERFEQYYEPLLYPAKEKLVSFYCDQLATVIQEKYAAGKVKTLQDFVEMIKGQIERMPWLNKRAPSVCEFYQSEKRTVLELFLSYMIILGKLPEPFKESLSSSYKSFSPDRKEAIRLYRSMTSQAQDKIRHKTYQRLRTCLLEPNAAESNPESVEKAKGVLIRYWQSKVTTVMELAFKISSDELAASPAIEKLEDWHKTIKLAISQEQWTEIRHHKEEIADCNGAFVRLTEQDLQKLLPLADHLDKYTAAELIAEVEEASLNEAADAQVVALQELKALNILQMEANLYENILTTIGNNISSLEASVEHELYKAKKELENMQRLMQQARSQQMVVEPQNRPLVANSASSFFQAQNNGQPDPNQVLDAQGFAQNDNTSDMNAPRSNSN